MYEGYGFKFNAIVKVNLLKRSFVHFQFDHELHPRIATLFAIAQKYIVSDTPINTFVVINIK